MDSFRCPLSNRTKTHGHGVGAGDAEGLEGTVLVEAAGADLSLLGCHRLITRQLLRLVLELEFTAGLARGEHEVKK